MLLQAHGLNFSYDSSRDVLHHVDLEVASGQVIGLIGPNGSGKSTLIKVLADLLRLRSGRVTVQGIPHEHRDAKAAMMYLASNDFLPEFLTGQEYLSFMHGLYNTSLDRDLAASFFERYQMGGRHRDLIEDYSHGMRKKVQLIAALMLRRPLTVIDETLNGIDIDAVYTFEQDLQELQAAGGGVILCSHDFRLLESVAERICFLHRGLMVEDLPTSAVIDDYGSLDAMVRDYVGLLQGQS